ncbi:fumarate reductase cytochrome b subunit [Candidatus Sulfurimonas baltica]|uniref:Fumarate reductase cytochrome b subunit n=1 Tax=Candidatus Sulfurimonas baltica TaxID=2740404 RepID=A0A7S7RP00_9BACT|nr:fumarate reductase cytochrome b subunit [Candidatus Sulfurimonas baltica]QOY53069.1 fumarate reductase cytochrome b subunit [Candidatus Sulfurimonas baltica]
MKQIKIDKIPARLDFIQSASGLILALFMWAHMFFVSTILLGKDVMYSVTKFFEGEYFFGESYPIIVTIAAGAIFIIFIVHALVALRKFPSNYKKYAIMKNHIKSLNHTDTTLWFWQVFTGFAMFFLGSVHLYIIMTNPSEIGPYASADRVVTEWMWPLYILLLLAVEIHGSVGIYRLALKWGWFEGSDTKKSRNNLRKLKYAITIFFLTLGFLTLAAYIKIGIEHKDKAGERYHQVTKTVQQGAQQ